MTLTEKFMDLTKLVSNIISKRKIEVDKRFENLEKTIADKLDDLIKMADEEQFIKNDDIVSYHTDCLFRDATDSFMAQRKVNTLAKEIGPILRKYRVSQLVVRLKNKNYE